MNEEAARFWMMRAEHDFTIALRDMEYPTPTTDMVCFHMQQAAEKYLKALLVFHGAPIAWKLLSSFARR